MKAKSKIEKNLEDYRFDEAAKNAYQFAWHSYCDWYLELSKTILFSDNEEAKTEVRKVSSLCIQANFDFITSIYTFCYRRNLA